jgi:mannosyl-oligosaccharide alpha-1,2-mannosidase
MALRRVAFVALTFFTITLAALAANVQKPNIILPPTAEADRNAVTNAFVTAYSTYHKYAFGHDDLEPVSMSYDNSRNGWGATIFDAMDTMLVMGLMVNHSSTNLSGLTVPWFHT